MTSASENPFTDIHSTTLKRGLKVAIWGSEGTGKTHFAMTFPAPLFIVDTEMGAMPLRKKFKEKEISVINVVSVADDAASAWEADDVADFEQVLKGIDYLLSRPIEQQKGTIIIDSATDLWSMIQGFGKVKLYKLRPMDRLKSQFDWGPITKLHRTLLRRLLKSPYNVVLTGKSGDVYDDAQKTGERIGRFQKDVPYLCDVIVKLDKRYVNKEVTRVATIEKCRMNGLIDQKSLTTPSYNALVEMIKTEE